MFKNNTLDIFLSYLENLFWGEIALGSAHQVDTNKIPELRFYGKIENYPLNVVLT